MRKTVLISLLLVLIILLVFIVVYGYRGNTMTHDKIYLDRSSQLNLTNTIVCESYDREKITTFTEYKQFQKDCGLMFDYGIDNTYFQTDVIVVYLILEEANHPTQFFDHPFSTRQTEIINYRVEKTPRDIPVLYLIYATKEDIISENVIFDQIQ
ncbi:MAG: hypothetical protein K9L26_01655 [Candidatus Izimaplasma sp.]|nr:hypothetical protein [Candidatus Izimaplasma bacterium]